MLIIKNNRYIPRYKQLFFAKYFFLSKRFFLSSQVNIEIKDSSLVATKRLEQSLAISALDKIKADINELVETRSFIRGTTKKCRAIALSRVLENVVVVRSTLSNFISITPRLEYKQHFEKQAFKDLKKFKVEKMGDGLKAVRALVSKVKTEFAREGYSKKVHREIFLKAVNRLYIELVNIIEKNTLMIYKS